MIHKRGPQVSCLQPLLLCSAVFFCMTSAAGHIVLHMMCERKTDSDEHQYL